jgi:hypothetical protein
LQNWRGGKRYFGILDFLQHDRLPYPRLRTLFF